MKLKEKEYEEEVEEDIDESEEELEDEDDLYGDDLIDDYYGEDGVPPIDKHKDLLKDLTNFEPYLKETFNNWLGVTWDEKEEKFKPNKALTPTMSLRGAAWCSGLLKTYTRNNNIITDISREDFKNIMLDHIDAIWLNLGTRDDFGIKEDGDLIRIANELEHAAALALMGAGDGKYNKMLGTTFSHHTTINPTTGPQQGGQIIQVKQGILDKIKIKLAGI